MREFLQLSLRLMVFTLVAGLLLALTNAVTEGPIKAQQQNAGGCLALRGVPGCGWL